MNTHTLIIGALLSCACFTQALAVPKPFESAVIIEISTVKPLSGAGHPVLSLETIYLTPADSARFTQARAKDLSGQAMPSSAASATGLSPSHPVFCYVSLPGDEKIPVRLVGLKLEEVESPGAILNAAPTYLEREIIHLLMLTRNEEFEGYLNRLLGARYSSSMHPELGIPYRSHQDWAKQNL